MASWHRCRPRFGFRNSIVVRAIALACALMMIEVAEGQTPADPSTRPDDSQIVKDFEARVSHYLQQRKKQAGKSPRPTTSPEKLDQSRQSLAQKSKDLREEAKQGDIFAPDIADYFRHQIGIASSGPQGVKVRTSLRHAEPVRGLTLHVNQSYPRGIPLQSMPASLLSTLPPLPKELQYRIADRSLILLDLAPNVIVDFIPDAIPLTKD